jgi:Flp pilus assembly protein TadG
MARARTRAGERGQVAVYAVLLFPLLMLVLALVLAVGSVEGLRTRIRAQLDMAALTATQALDLDALARGGEPVLDPATADALVREYLARNLAALGDQIASSPSSIAGAAEVVVMNTPGLDPITGAPNTAPTVSIRIRVPARIPLLGLAGMDPTVELTLTGSAAARS